MKWQYMYSCGHLIDADQGHSGLMFQDCPKCSNDLKEGNKDEMQDK